MKSLFDKKDNASWLKNLLAKNVINEEESFKLAQVLEEHAMARDGDETARWWKNLGEEKWNGCVPFWSKLACKKELDDSEGHPTELDFIEDVIERVPEVVVATIAPTTAAPATTAAPTPANDDPAFLGCWVDKRKRDMPKRFPNFKPGQEKKCFDKCRSAGYKYAGLQWYGECWCDNTYGSYGEATEKTNTQCDCRMGAKKFSFWGNCVYDLAVEAAEAEHSDSESDSEEHDDITSLPVDLIAPSPFDFKPSARGGRGSAFMKLDSSLHI